MRSRPFAAIGLATVVVFGGAGLTVGTDSQAHADEAQSVLFVGNSFTYFNGGVETHVAGLVASEETPRDLTVEASTIPGATLRVHQSQGAGERIRDGDFDIVVLQGDIPELYGDLDAFFENAQLLDAVVDAEAGHTVFFMTWPYERLDWVTLDEIVAAHRVVEAELGATVAPVGLAMANALAERPDLAMLGPDAEHESMAGTYLAAATIYATLFDQSPEGLAYRPDDVSEADAAFLQSIAWQTVQDWRSSA